MHTDNGLTMEKYQVSIGRTVLNVFSAVLVLECRFEKNIKEIPVSKICNHDNTLSLH